MLLPVPPNWGPQFLFPIPPHLNPRPHPSGRDWRTLHPAPPLSLSKFSDLVSRSADAIPSAANLKATFAAHSPHHLSRRANLQRRGFGRTPPDHQPSPSVCPRWVLTLCRAWRMRHPAPPTLLSPCLPGSLPTDGQLHQPPTHADRPRPASAEQRQHRHGLRPPVSHPGRFPLTASQRRVAP